MAEGNGGETGPRPPLVSRSPRLSPCSGGGGAAAGAPDEPVLVAVGAGAEPAAALEAVPLVAAVAGAAEHVALAAAAGAGGGEGGGGGHDAAELAGLVEAPDLLGAAEVAAQSMSAPLGLLPRSATVCRY